MFGYLPSEWALLTRTEKRIVTFAVKYKVEDATLMKKCLAWPLEEPFPDTTFASIMSRLRKKVAKMTAARAISSPPSV